MTPTPIDDSQRVVPVDLLPCPFCGGQAECVQRGSFMEDIPYVCCQQCQCFQYAEELDVAISAWNRRDPAASPPVAPLAAAQEGVKPIPACWRYVHADPSNSSGWMDYDGDAELWELRGKKAQANGLTIELAYSRPPAQTQGESRYTGVLDDPKMQELFSSTIMGALAFGAQNTNPPPDGHWLTQFWNIGRTSQPTPPATPEARRDGEAMDVFNRAARDLPEGWIVAVHLEKDSGGIELTDPDGTIIGTDYCSLSIDSQIDAAVRVAIDAAQADHEGV